jgi:predicted NBD/HSP70 family sugar kinase
MIRQRLFKDQVLSDRERKNISILELIGKNGPMTKTDISKITELNIVTVSNYINNYIKAGIVEEKGFDVSSGGRKPTLIDLNYKSGYVIGIGVNNTFDKIVAVMVDYGSNLIVEKQVDWNPEVRSEKLIEEMANIVEVLIQESGVEQEKITGIGVGLPGIVDERGITVKWPSSVGKMDISVCISVRSLLEKKFRIPIFIEKDDVTAVAGERWLGLNSDIQNVLFMFSGIGCGLMINGQLYRGTSGISGEFALGESNEDEAAAYARWDIEAKIAKQVKQKVKDGEESSLSGKTSLKLKDIVKASNEGDKVAMEAIQDVGQILGKKISFLINLLNPEVVVIGGGIEEAGPIFLDSIRRAVKVSAVEEASNVVKIIPSILGEKTIALGAASVVIQEMFAQV